MGLVRLGREGVRTESGCVEGVEVPTQAGGARGGGFGADGGRGKVGALAGEPEITHLLETVQDAGDLGGDEGAGEGEDEAGEEVLGEGEAEFERESGRGRAGGCGGVLGLRLRG
jgi:hypothetical protein